MGNRERKIRKSPPNETEISEDTVEQAITDELPRMKPEFKKKLLLTARHGTPEEKEELAKQVRKFVRTREEVQPVEIDAEQIRERLNQDENVVPVDPIDNMLVV